MCEQQGGGSSGPPYNLIYLIGLGDQSVNHFHYNQFRLQSRYKETGKYVQKSANQRNADIYTKGIDIRQDKGRVGVICLNATSPSAIR